VEITLFNAVPKAIERTRLVRVRAIDKDPWVLAFQRESKVDVRAEAVGYIDQTKLIELIVNLRKGVLKHVFLTLKNS